MNDSGLDGPIAENTHNEKIIDGEKEEETEQDRLALRYALSAYLSGGKRRR
jgi:hypothetical protein